MKGNPAPGGASAAFPSVVTTTTLTLSSAGSKLENVGPEEGRGPRSTVCNARMHPCNVPERKSSCGSLQVQDFAAQTQ
jgi:hypothetical protein